MLARALKFRREQRSHSCLALRPLRPLAILICYLVRTAGLAGGSLRHRSSSERRERVHLGLREGLAENADGRAQLRLERHVDQDGVRTSAACAACASCAAGRTACCKFARGRLDREVLLVNQLLARGGHRLRYRHLLRSCRLFGCLRGLRLQQRALGTYHPLGRERRLHRNRCHRALDRGLLIQRSHLLLNGDRLCDGRLLLHCRLPPMFSNCLHVLRFQGDEGRRRRRLRLR